MEEWMKDVDTYPDLMDCIAEFAYGHGGCLMTDICKGLGHLFIQMAREQDLIGFYRVVLLQGMNDH
jgi:hypothetical protein